MRRAAVRMRELPRSHVVLLLLVFSFVVPLTCVTLAEPFVCVLRSFFFLFFPANPQRMPEGQVSVEVRWEQSRAVS